MLVTNHDALGYLAARYDLEVVGTVIPGSSTQAEADPRQFAELVDTVEERGITTVFAENTDSTAPGRAARQRGRRPRRPRGRGRPGRDRRARRARAARAETYLGLLRETGTTIADARRGLMRTAVHQRAVACVGAYRCGRREPVAIARSTAAERCRVLELLTEPFGFDFLRNTLYAGLLTVVASSLIGTWVVMRGMSFMGDALAHGVLPGIAIAYIIGGNLLVGGAVSAAVMIGGVTLALARSRLGEDVSIGLLFVGMLAAGVAIISKGGAYAGDLTTILFGEPLGVTPDDVRAAAVAAVVDPGRHRRCSTGRSWCWPSPGPRRRCWACGPGSPTSRCSR